MSSANQNCFNSADQDITFFRASKIYISYI
jgi:hypothetical protein